MTVNAGDPFADQGQPPPNEGDIEEFLYAQLLWEQRHYRPGVWMMFGGKRPEPERNDPFKPVGEWVTLDEDLWTGEASRIEWWAGHPHPSVRRVVSAHETCPPELLAGLATDPWVEIRQAALANSAVDPETVQKAAADEPVSWLREALGRDDPALDGRCAVCGGRVKRPDRFLTCRIDCSLTQHSVRIGDGTYMKRGRRYWPAEYIWSVADRGAPGGVPGTGPRFRPVRISFVPGLNAEECDRAVTGISESQGLTMEQAVDTIDQMTRKLDGPSLLEACTST